MASLASMMKHEPQWRRESELQQHENDASVTLRIRRDVDEFRWTYVTEYGTAGQFDDGVMEQLLTLGLGEEVGRVLVRSSGRILVLAPGQQWPQEILERDEGEIHGKHS